VNANTEKPEKQATSKEARVKLAHSEGKPAKCAISKPQREKIARYKDAY
jgi:hypothetical protein